LPNKQARDGNFRRDSAGRKRKPGSLAFVRPGLVRASPSFVPQKEDVDGRDKPSHDVAAALMRQESYKNGSLWHAHC
jgi:hypothetical protein